MSTVDNGNGRGGDAELWSRRASSFGAEAAAYAEHRPDYPPAGIRWALEPLGDSPDLEVLDLAAGTGKLTSGLLALGARVTAVEPDPGMRAEFVRQHREVPVLDGTAEAIPLPSGSIHAVLIGQALHWFDEARAFPEIARVLRPGGVVAALWNTTDTSVEWVAEMDRLARSGVGHQTRSRDPIPAHSLFEPFERAEFPHAHRRTAESLAATIGTHSHTLVIDQRERAEILTRVTAYLRTRPETGAGEFDLPLRTVVLRAVRR